METVHTASLPAGLALIERYKLDRLRSNSVRLNNLMQDYRSQVRRLKRQLAAYRQTFGTSFVESMFDSCSYYRPTSWATVSSDSQAEVHEAQSLKGRLGISSVTKAQSAVSYAKAALSKMEHHLHTPPFRESTDADLTQELEEYFSPEQQVIDASYRAYEAAGVKHSFAMWLWNLNWWEDVF